ncbi:MAG: glycosyltransferase family 2 protein [Anaerolineales bacterium]|nr:glycosyltransferase family 2 protein [Anaerolineales bacterium]
MIDKRPKFPFVSVIMPVRNEGAFIAHSLGSVLAQDYSIECMEVLVVDGMSDDGTRDVVQRLAGQTAVSVKLIDNPAGIVSPGLNKGIKQAAGEIIMRVDGHCEIAPNYVARCVETLRQTGADCVGGAMVTVGETAVAQAISSAQSSPFGVGDVTFRTGCKEGAFVDTLAFGAYRREVFERLGGFDEELVRNQDDEFNFRLTQAGGKIWLDPAIRSVYYSRASLPKLWRQYYQYGLYKVRVMQKRRAVAAWRHLVPGLFVLSIVGSLLLSLVTQQKKWFTLVTTPYIMANLAATTYTARGKWRIAPILPLAFAVLHSAYGLGFLHGLWHWRGCFRDG